MPTSFEPCRVLIAEDHNLSSELLERTLKSWGYRVVVTDNGADALAIIESDNPPQLAVLDWMMPNLTGPEVCTRVRQNANRRYVYLLLLTAKGEKQEIAHGLEAGADDYMVKPFRSDELHARLQLGQRVLALEHRVADLTLELQKTKAGAS